MEFQGSLPKTNKPKINNGHWQFPEQMGNGVGFLYVIRDNYLKRFYLGKKFYKNRNRATYANVESNWRTYTSSSKVLKELFKHRPIYEEFDFIALEEYETKGTLAYAETWSLCYVEAPTNNQWYNTMIGKVFWKIKEPITERHKERLKAALEFRKMENE